MRIVSIDEFRGGLNNQKMILAGCFFLAKELGAKVALPGDIVNFIPTAHGYKRYPLKFKDVFNLDYFLKAMPSNILADGADNVTDVLSWKGLGNCHPNQQVEVLDFLGNFRSTGSDPFLTFPATEIAPDKRYVLEVDLKSNVDSLASVYFQEESDDRFSERKSVKLPIKIGDNKLSFSLPDCRLKPILRFDPLNSKGNFSLKNLILKIVK